MEGQRRQDRGDRGGREYRGDPRAAVGARAAGWASPSRSKPGAAVRGVWKVAGFGEGEWWCGRLACRDEAGETPAPLNLCKPFFREAYRVVAGSSSRIFR